ncbi:hypothetical protein BOKEGFJH_00827 [Chlamydia avium]|uniref:SUF system FeS cluster assembly SufBD core domain-containing protein n=1 Tax=Chlamydia avium TaxID=1457141 RepID=A0ABP2X7A9_9CHLA|nr:SufD family Fe-S cluster assembly protein [Chlamydia avium]EPP36278.1 hypothetical protein CP10743SC13_0195 [Chlamydia psittaci 10_743_SC13]EPP38705.1 hypothetical protein CP10881SC42_0282 [Chlamydia avium]VVT43284.1 hypothetical protein BOKEGFJH_00827 [Chlamydia avium]
MLGLLEHSSLVGKDSSVHQAIRECCCRHADSEGFKNVFRWFPWLKNMLSSPEKYYLAHGASEVSKQQWLHHKHSLSAECILINGKYEASLSQLPDGVLGMSLGEAQAVFSNLLRKYDVGDQPLAFFNAVCSHDFGVVLYVPEDMQMNETLCIRHVCFPLSHDDRVIYSPKIVVIVGKRASCQIQISHHTERSSGVMESFSVVNGVTEIFVSEEAEVMLTMSPKYIHEERVSWSHSVTVEERGAYSVHYDLLADVHGVGWFDNNFSLVGDHAYGETLVSILSPKQTWMRNQMYHDAASTTSQQLIKSILYSGNFSFEGGIHISSRGMFSDAHQKHDTLLLGDQASVTTFPRLEILTDDVKASHGATVGPLDLQQIFYMRSRGMTYEEAQKKLVQGFLIMHPSLKFFPKLVAQQQQDENGRTSIDTM